MLVWWEAEWLWSGSKSSWHPIPWYVFWHRLRGRKWYRWVDDNPFHSEWEMEFASDLQLAQIYLKEKFGDA